MPTSTDRPSRRTGPRPGLTRERIVDAALELISADGLERLGMRPLAARMGVDPMSLYNHIPGKDALIGELQTRMAASLAVEPAGANALRRTLEQTTVSYRALALRYPDAFPLLFTRPLTTPGPRRPAEAVLETLRRAGCTPADAIQAMTVLFAFLNGYLLTEVANRPDLATRRLAGDPGPDAGMGGADGAFPRLAELAATAVDFDPDERFAEASAVVIDGLMRFVTDRRRTASPRTKRRDRHR